MSDQQVHDTPIYELGTGESLPAQAGQAKGQQVPQAQHVHSQEQQQQQQQFPLPPDTLGSNHDQQQQQQQQQLQQQQQQQFPPPPSQPSDPQHASYTIPPYDPAHPALAPNQPSAATLNAEPKKSSWSDRFAHFGSKAAAPINSIAHKLGSQSFLPETLDKECDKAAAILKSFCTKGVYADPSAAPTSTHPSATESSGAIIDPTKEKPKNRVLVTIPPKVISKAVGLAIFTTLRAGFQVSGATGSGVLIARLPNGTWSPPSGIQVHSVGGGFQIGLDIYDCVCVINSKEALAAFMDTRVSLGSDLAVVAGPYGAGGAVDFGTAVERGREEKAALRPDDEKAKRRSVSASALKPVFSYVKSRGFYAGVQVDGTVVVERREANAAFYGAPVSVQQVLQGQVQQHAAGDRWPVGARELLATLKGAEGVQQQPAPAVHVQAADDGTGTAASHFQAGSADPPAYVDGMHAHVSDAKYA